MDTDLAELKAEVAGVAASVKTELRGVNARLGTLEKAQLCLVQQMTAGRTTVKVLRWIGGVTLAVSAVAAAFWERISG